MNATAIISKTGTLTIHHETCGHTQTVRAAACYNETYSYGSAADFCDRCGAGLDYPEPAPAAYVTPPEGTTVRTVEVVIPVAVSLRILVNADGEPVEVVDAPTSLRIDYDTGVNYGEGELWDEEAEAWRCPTEAEVLASDTALARALGLNIP